MCSRMRRICSAFTGAGACGKTGLKMTATRAVVDVLVVEHAEKPSAN